MRKIVMATILIGSSIGIVLALLAWRVATAPQEVSTPESSSSSIPPAAIIQSSPTTTTLRAQSITGAAPQFTFTAFIPSTWQAEALPATQAINIYDPAAQGTLNLEKSQIFIRFFEANDFLTLTTVDILDRQELTYSGRPAVRYQIQKKASVPAFTSQPSWRNEGHIVTDIRVSDTNPSVFYVIAQRPGLPNEVYERFLDSLRVSEAAINSPTTSQLTLPVAEFHSRLTKKPFGLYISPATSPVQPERFEGYHTGVDVEYADVATDVPVRAVASGMVLLSQRSSGYGGVVAIQHNIQEQPMVAIYGHLDPASIPKPRSAVTAGQQIGILGEENTTETDGERKHLHFALYKGTRVNLRGYVADANDLAQWLDPLEVLY